jgi:hypothetical protein
MTERRKREFGNDSVGRDAPDADLGKIIFAKPQRTVRPGRDAGGEAAGGRGALGAFRQGKFGNHSGGGDAPDLVGLFDEPQRAVRPRRLKLLLGRSILLERGETLIEAGDDDTSLLLPPCL